MKQVQINAYKYSELSSQAQEMVISKVDLLLGTASTESKYTYISNSLYNADGYTIGRPLITNPKALELTDDELKALYGIKVFTADDMVALGEHIDSGKHVNHSGFLFNLRDLHAYLNRK